MSFISISLPTPLPSFGDPSWAPPLSAPVMLASNSIPPTMQPEEKELFLRVHRKHDHGVLTSRGFLSSAESPLALSHHASARYPGSSGLELEQSASTHVTQWINCTWDQPSPFVSMARSVPYVLFESRRWDLLHSANQPHISIIDAAKLIQTTDIWLATDLLEDKYQQDVFFACRAEEVLAYSRIPLDAVVATVPLNSFFDCLPPWCEGIKEDIRRDRLWSTAEVADALENLVRQHCNTAAAEKELLEHSVRKSLEILRGTLLPRWMASFNETKHAAAIDRIAGFASVFCWWPEWIVGNDASGYPALSRAVRGQVVQRLRTERSSAKMSGTSQRSGVVRSPAGSYRVGTPYARPVKQESF